MYQTVIALYSDFISAYSVKRDLSECGFRAEQIALVACERAQVSSVNGFALKSAIGQKTLQEIKMGGGVGVVLGSLVGLLFGVMNRNMMIGLGLPVPIEQLLAVWVTIGFGALGAGVIGCVGVWIVTARNPRGGTLIMLRTDMEFYNQALCIIKRYSPVMIEQRSDESRNDS
jgi:hypothetical protein